MPETERLVNANLCHEKAEDGYNLVLQIVSSLPLLTAIICIPCRRGGLHSLLSLELTCIKIGES